jgi:hypothetical protein
MFNVRETYLDKRTGRHQVLSVGVQKIWRDTILDKRFRNGERWQKV